MIFLSGIFWRLETMLGVVQATAKGLHLTYLDEGLRDVMIAGNDGRRNATVDDALHTKRSGDRQVPEGQGVASAADGVGLEGHGPDEPRRGLDNQG